MRKAILGSFVLLLALGTLAQAATLNEIRIDQPSTDNDEYFELNGTPNEDVGSLTLISIGDGTGGSGVVEAVVPLAGLTLNATGFLFIAEDTDTAGFVPTATADLEFENSDNLTFFLVEGFSGNSGDDLDTDDDGTLDVTPWTSIVDEVALLEEVGAGDLVYSSVTVGPDGTFVPGHVFRDVDGTGTWTIGDFTFPTDDTPGFSNQATLATPVVSTLAELRANLNKTVFFNGTMTVTVETSGLQATRFQLFAQDTSGADGQTGILIDDSPFNLGVGYSAGDVIGDITGLVTEFSGIIEFQPDSTAGTFSTGTVPAPLEIDDTFTDFEAIESELIEINGAEIIPPTDTTTWDANRNYQLIDNAFNGPIQAVRIEDNSNLVGQSLPTGPFRISGVAVEFDSGDPAEQYQIQPVTLSDIGPFTGSSQSSVMGWRSYR